ncbi:hypothetical protein L9F63_004634, partial [Diploptera punctata]
IHGLDWSPTHENQLATSSQDCTVKFFDITNPRRAESILPTASPVWRARYTPFGEGLITVVVPQLRRGENSLHLWNIANQTSPVHTFVGHTDVVLEFQWRKHKEDSLDYELITWSKDQSLRIWRIEPFLQKLCGHERDVDHSIDTQEAEDATSGRTTIGWGMDAVRRSCTVTATRNAHVVILQVNFPPNYPYNAAPTFQFAQGTSIDNNTMVKLLKEQFFLSSAIFSTVEFLPPLSSSKLSSSVDMMNFEIKSNTSGISPSSLHHSQPSSYLDSTNNIYSSFQDAYVPFPRTSGAKFCSVGILVCFGRPPFARRMSTRLESPTPRSLSALAGNLNSFTLGGSSSSNTSQYSLMYPPVAQSPTGDPNVSITSFYFQDRKQPTRSRSRGVHGSSRVHGSSKTTKKGSRAIVTIYDASALLYVHKELGEKYVFDCHDLSGMCHRNSAIAAQVGRRDLVQAWTLAALAATPSSQPALDQEDDIPWPYHPFGKAMVETLISYYAKQSDIQMAAMLCCTFGCRTENQDTYKCRQLSKSVNVSRLATGKWWLKPGSSPYHTIHQVDTSLEGWNYPMLKQNRSNSWSDSLDDLKFATTIVEHREINDNDSDKSLKILDDKNTLLYDIYKKAYAEVLHRWNLLDARAQVLKYMSTPGEPHRGVEFCTECQYCNKQIRGPSCVYCKRLALQCCICHVSVKGIKYV